MRVKIVAPKGILVGSAWRNPGEIVELDDALARRLIEAKHGEAVSPGLAAPPAAQDAPAGDPHRKHHETATAPHKPERTSRRGDC